MSRRKIHPQKKKRPGITNQTVRFTPDGLEITVSEVAEEDQESLCLYVNSHRLMPFDYVYDGGPECLMAVETAASILERQLIDECETARAIAILGHSPCQRAIETLTRATDLPYPFGRMAYHALSECISIGQSPPPGFAGVIGSWPGA